MVDYFVCKLYLLILNHKKQPYDLFKQKNHYSVLFMRDENTFEDGIIEQIDLWAVNE